MLRQFLVGAAASGCNIAIHALVMVVVIKVARSADELATAYQTLRLISVMIATVTVLMIAHLAEVLVWSLIYAVIDVAPEGADLSYFAFVNYTTLGYGDVTPVKRWHLLGPMTAMNGVLMFGWSTAVIFEVLRMTLLVERRGGSPTEAGMAQLKSTHTTAGLICIKPAEGVRVSLAEALWFCLVRAASKLPNVPRASDSGKQHETLDRIIGVADCRLHDRNDGTTSAVVYCQYVEYPAGCTVRPGVVLRPRPVARAVATPGVGRVGTPTNRGGPVDRAGRR